VDAPGVVLVLLDLAREPPGFLLAACDFGQKVAEVVGQLGDAGWGRGYVCSRVAMRETSRSISLFLVCTFDCSRE
jgi:hypothetical protein